MIHPPYSLTVKEAAVHFGFHPATIYRMIDGGQLRRGYHYLKVGNKKLIIIRERFIEWLHEEDGSNGDVQSGLSR